MKQNGTLWVLNTDGTPIGSTTSCTVTISVDTPETSNKGSGGWRELLEGGGLRSGSATFEGFYDPAEANNVSELFALITNRTDWAVAIQPDSAGFEAFRCSKAILAGLEITYEMEQPVSISGTAEFSGSIELVTTT